MNFDTGSLIMGAAAVLMLISCLEADAGSAAPMCCVIYCGRLIVVPWRPGGRRRGETLAQIESGSREDSGCLRFKSLFTRMTRMRRIKTDFFFVFEVFLKIRLDPRNQRHPREKALL
jgi:hypothetical protein